MVGASADSPIVTGKLAAPADDVVLSIPMATT